MKHLPTVLSVLLLAFSGSGFAADAAAQTGTPTPPASDGYRNLLRSPDAVIIVTESGTAAGQGTRGVFEAGGVRVTTETGADGMGVSVSAREAAVKKIVLHWNGPAEGAAWKYLGDAWERGYGDLGWKPLDGKRIMPWYFLASDGKTTHGYGVKTCPNAFCHWQADADGVTLTLDVRCGGRGVLLGARTLKACTVSTRRGVADERAFHAAQAFCKTLCPNPRMPKQPVYGFNDWYCNYGNISADDVRQDTAFLVRLAPKGGTRPFMVIDDGWQAINGGANGDWDRGNAKFPDMAALAGDIVKAGAKPGIWLRLLVARPGQPKEWKLARDNAFLDPSVPEVRAYVMETIKRLRGWGFQLIKHDFSTGDLAGRWGYDMGDEFTKDGWAFTDRSRTSAEIIIDFYRSIRKAAGEETLLMGCATIGHLSAGIFDLSRTGDDTSGREWERVRKMGVNTLAFRMPQHGAFFAVDADCVGQTDAGAIPWELNRQWLDILARSGTPLFVSFKRDSVSPGQEIAIKEALAAASRPQPVGEPVDWMETLLPTKWKLSGGEVQFHWELSKAGGGRPVIEKLGTIGVDLCETSPFVFKDRLYRLEWHRNGARLRIIDHDTRKEVCHFADNYAFPCVLVENGTVYVVATLSDPKGSFRQSLTLFTSTDLQTWKSEEIFREPKMRPICNTTLCKADGRYVLSVETGESGAWGSRFMETKDLKTWTLLPKKYHGGKPGRLYSPHMLRYHDGWFYLFATVAGCKPSPGLYGGYVMTLHRSRDLKTWEPSPFNPVLNGSDDDKTILNPDLTEKDRVDISANAIRNNSDMDVIEFGGKLVINYCWGTQGGKGHEYVAEARYNGTLAQFLEGWFPRQEASPQ